MNYDETVELVAKGIDGVGVAVIVIGIVVATVRVGARRDAKTNLYRTYRQQVGRAILLGLEFLVAADIIRSVAVAPTLRGVTVLAVIVAVRTFLSFTLEVELEGRWPWQRRNARD